MSVDLFSVLPGLPEEDACTGAGGWDLAARFANEASDYESEVWWLIVLCIVLALAAMYFWVRGHQVRGSVPRRHTSPNISVIARDGA